MFWFSYYFDYIYTISILNFGFENNLEVTEMEQLKVYECPEMEIILVDDADVIVTSAVGGKDGVVEYPFPW